jgi:hypothetical protein
MTQASGILSSANAVEGVPLSSSNSSSCTTAGVLCPKGNLELGTPAPLDVTSLERVISVSDSNNHGHASGDGSKGPTVAPATFPPTLPASSPFSYLYQNMVEQVPRARYLGVSRGVKEIGLGEMVLFCGPSGSTLALSASEISAEKVRVEIEKSEREFAEGQS